jgi:phage terminase large subunit
MGLGPAALLQRRDPFVLVEGPAGTGKTRSILTQILLDGLKYPRSRILLARATRESLTQSILVSLEEEVFPSLGLAIPGGAGRQNRSEYRLPNGTVLVPMGMDKPERLFSTAWDRIYVNEAIEVEKDKALKLARGMRGTHMPYVQAIFDTNPTHPGHWLNQIAEPAGDGLRHVETREQYARLQRFNRADPPKGFWKRIITKHQDNPYYFDHRAWRFTDFGAKYIHEKLGSYTGYLRMRLLDGLWVAAEGTVFPEFRLDRHVLPPFTPPPEWPYFVGYDPGYDHPTCVLWILVAPDDSLFVADEIYQGGRSVEQHCDEIHARNQGRTVRRYYGDPQEMFSDRSQGPSCATQAKKRKISFHPWPATGGNAQAMVNAVRNLLIGGRLRVMSHCVNTIREFQSWSFKRTTGGEVPAGDDAYEDHDNHAMDVIKGLVATKALVFNRGRGKVTTGE